MNVVLPHQTPDETWCEMLASYSVDELVAGELIAPEHREQAMRIVRQQAYVLLASSCYPAGDLIRTA